MTVHSSEEFRNAVLSHIGLTTKDPGNFRYYANPRGDHFAYYEKPGCYEFDVANYTIPGDFRLDFSNPTKMLRFGIVYTGTTRFKLKNQEVSSFSPSSFLVIEEDLSGAQVWKKGQHFHGAEITVYWDYLCRICQDFLGESFDSSRLLVNHTYHYLPAEAIQCISRMYDLSESRTLNPIYLEGLIYQCLGILCNEIYTKKTEFFSLQEPGYEITIGDRHIRLNPSDLHSLSRAHEILSGNYKNPPTIELLSQQVALNTQKLKSGFYHQYHMTIGEYILSLRMAAAASLLCTTTLHVQDIAREVGYAHVESFIKAFRNTYSKTPLQYRKQQIHTTQTNPK
ncbi:MAG: AraC family transcriptional regulator [Eubacteriales bacterium]|nr:AraC family transcriptional regulator [Eubacteriales bacterium]